jgi:proteasome lid subunit RPN8/RPN11
VYCVSQVAISGQVIEKVVMEAREHPDEQIVGVLLGGQSGGTIVVEEAVTGPAETDATRATLTGDSIARIADDIINKRVRGSIVGWYHSHVRGGVFMSELDVETQLKLQQFSPLVTAMVIDAQTGQSGFFRADAKTKGSIPVPSQNVNTEITAPVSTPYVVEQAMYPQGPTPPSATPVSIRTILVVVVLITLAVTSGIIALAYYRGPGTYSGNLAITHKSPTGPFFIANPITFDANVTGSNLQNVTLAYRVIQQAPSGKGLVVGDLVKVPMLLRAAGQDTYSYTVPSSEIAGVYIQYYITAFDTSGNVARTDIYNLSIGDFDWVSDKTDEVVAVRTIPTTVTLETYPINGFNRAVTIKVVGSVPAGVSIRPLSAQVVPPNPAILQITSTKDSEMVTKYDVEIDAVYSPPSASAIQIIRRTTLVLTVTDFDLDVTPLYMESGRGTDVYVSYTVKLSVHDGFTALDGFKFSVTGLPDRTSWKLELVSYKIDENGLATSVYNLVIKVESNAPTGLFLFTVLVSARSTGGSISHDVENIQLKVV